MELSTKKSTTRSNGRGKRRITCHTTKLIGLDPPRGGTAMNLSGIGTVNGYRSGSATPSYKED